MMPQSHYRIPKIARHAAFCHMSDYDLEIRSCGWVRSSLASVHDVYQSMAMVRPDERAEMTQRSPTSLIRSCEAKASRDSSHFVIRDVRCCIEDFERTDDANSLDYQIWGMTMQPPIG